MGIKQTVTADILKAGDMIEIYLDGHTPSWVTVEDVWEDATSTSYPPSLKIETTGGTLYPERSDVFTVVAWSPL